MAAHNTATYFYFCFFETVDVFVSGKPYMLASAGQLSLHGYDACLVYWTKRALRGISRQKIVRPLFLLFGFFC